MKKRFSISTVCALMLLVAAATFTITFVQVKDFFNSQLNITAAQQAEMKKYLEARENIENSYVGDIDPDILMDTSIAGMVQGLGDGESYYLDREGYAKYKESQNNKYVGVGISCGFDAAREALVVTGVQAGSPAAEAGIKEFDSIMAVNEKSVSTAGYNAVIGAMLGEEGTTVRVDIVTADGMRRTAELIRRQINTEPVHSEILENNIGYVKISNFESGVGVDFKDSVAKLVEAGVRGLVIDVRFNSSGRRQELTIALDALVGEEIIFVSADRKGDKEEIISDAAETDLPMTVIVNGYTMNTAEYFAAVLQEYGKARIIGQKTPGKGYVQVPIALNDDSAIILSTREYITPKGAKIAGIGVTPDTAVNMSPGDIRNFATLGRDKDQQFIKAVEAVELLIAVKSE